MSTTFPTKVLDASSYNHYGTIKIWISLYDNISIGEYSLESQFKDYKYDIACQLSNHGHQKYLYDGRLFNFLILNIYLLSTGLHTYRKKQDITINIIISY